MIAWIKRLNKALDAKIEGGLAQVAETTTKCKEKARETTVKCKEKVTEKRQEGRDRDLRRYEKIMGLEQGELSYPIGGEVNTKSQGVPSMQKPPPPPPPPNKRVRSNDPTLQNVSNALDIINSKVYPDKMAGNSVYVDEMSGNSITINGQTHNVSGHNIQIKNNAIYADGKLVVGELQGIVEVKWSGDLASLKSDSAVIVNGNVKGNASSNLSLNCGNVKGNASSKLSLTCKDVGGNADSKMSITCKAIKGNAKAGMSIRGV